MLLSHFLVQTRRRLLTLSKPLRPHDRRRYLPIGAAAAAIRSGEFQKGVYYRPVHAFNIHVPRQRVVQSGDYRTTIGKLLFRLRRAGGVRFFQYA